MGGINIQHLKSNRVMTNSASATAKFTGISSPSTTKLVKELNEYCEFQRAAARRGTRWKMVYCTHSALF